MRILFRHSLEHEKSINYFHSVMERGNSLSKELMNLVDFEKGRFFTLLPENANFDKLYNFRGGWILPQNPIKDYINDAGKKSFYSWKPKLNRELGYFIYDKMKSEVNSLCIFEDVVTEPGDSYTDFSRQYGTWLSNEFYNSLNSNNATPELIVSAINESSIDWHSLFLLTKAKSIDIQDKEITFVNLKGFINRTQLLIVEAYDGEGYVFWEPEKTPEHMP